MSSSITNDDVKKLAKLSALHVDDNDVAALQADLNHILEYVDQLGQVDTTDVEPTYQVIGGLSTVTRPDEVINYGISRDEMLKNAADQQDGQIKVPRVIE
jgi:aspartyl-tRNA(Asn)/glutamyl-tRNA(Gln) amidotransferase subunit C